MVSFLAVWYLWAQVARVAMAENQTEIMLCPPNKIELVTNVGVHAVLHNEKLRTLQLYVNWTAPTEGCLPKGLNVEVYAINTSDYCTAGQDIVMVEDMSTSHALVPQSISNIADDALITIKHECNYMIKIASQPYDGKRSATTCYHVPEIVDGLHSCRHRENLPVATHFAVKPINDTSVLVTWKLEKNTFEYDIVKFDVGVMFLVKPVAVVPRKWVGSVNYTDDYDLEYSYVISSDIKPGMGYMVLLRVQDENGCYGNVSTTHFIYQDKKEKEISKTDMLIIIIVAPTVTILVLTIIIAILWRRYGWGEWIRQKLSDRRRPPGTRKADGEYQVVRRDDGTRAPLQNRNLIYVEKEIEEAKARGEVDSYEVHYDRLELGREIGKGAFGKVFLARAEAILGKPGFTTVAVKKLKHRSDPDTTEEFLQEIHMMKLVGQHPNVVTMLGCCTLQEPYCMIMEYVPCGDLLQYLRKLRTEYERLNGGPPPVGASTTPQSPKHIDLLLSTDSEGSYVQPERHLSINACGRPSIAESEYIVLNNEAGPSCSSDNRDGMESLLDIAELQSFAIQIARGMAHLEGKLITHRDLAARNVLIDEYKTLKISDFGLSRSGVYVTTRRKKVPLRWLSVEAIRDSRYSNKSDVWSYGIVLWEIGTLGGFPYSQVPDMDVVRFLTDGKRLEKPKNCTDELYRLMTECWFANPEDRPTFAEIVEHLEEVTANKNVYVEFHNLHPNFSLPPIEGPSTSTMQSTNRRRDTTERTSK